MGDGVGDSGGVQLLKPVLVGQCDCVKWMPDNLRHSRFLAFGENKNRM